MTIERRGRVAIVRLNDPDARNALSTDLIHELIAVIGEADGDAGLSCLVLTGVGKAFCAGGNVKDMLEGDDPMFGGTPHQMAEGYRRNIQQMTKCFLGIDIPVIAAVNGAAIGAGNDLACLCDIRVASTHAKFAESFLRVGLVPGDGGAWLLPRIVGLPRALEMALTCRVLDAQEAKEWGIATHVVEPDKLEEAALALAETIAGFPPISVRLNKRLILKSVNMGIDECLELSATYQAIVQNTADQKEAVAAVVEKREPKYVGR
ncbi:enoyl-CoA hydratase-related protein [Sphingomonas sp. BIUV-7]|uniref:Enoyl-CoA hydratase-related protein n=1 Tax=Sphingomonas natans TaxID=3063330 RepID=A0ABT8Y6W2_9SPHN|nr:enoyl-CoA hydratase-related protein [Sphingomonas sp. BIUV-7]MDO6414061.1 enoyl-CoA hydratase-related protein [Sphingomonas sp. BIUV-7]